MATSKSKTAKKADPEVKTEASAEAKTEVKAEAEAPTGISMDTLGAPAAVTAGVVPASEHAPDTVVLEADLIASYLPGRSRTPSRVLVARAGATVHKDDIERTEKQNARVEAEAAKREKAAKDALAARQKAEAEVEAEAEAEAEVEKGDA